MVKVTEIKGTVEVKANGSAAFSPAAVGQELHQGDELRTGTDGRVTFMLDDGTAAILTENATLTMTTISGTTESPITKFFLDGGEIVTLHDGKLAKDAAYEVETPSGVAAIRGSSLVVHYDAKTKTMTAACLEGTCQIKQPDGEVIQVEPGQEVEVEEDGTVSEPREIPSDKQDTWDDTIYTCDCTFDPNWFFDDQGSAADENVNANDNASASDNDNYGGETDGISNDNSAANSNDNFGGASGGDTGTITGGDTSGTTGSDSTTTTGSDTSTTTGGDTGATTTGDSGSITGGDSSATTTGGDISTTTGGDISTTGGDASTTTGGDSSGTTGGDSSTTGGDSSSTSGGDSGGTTDSSSSGTTDGTTGG